MKENVLELFEIINIAEDLGVDCLVYHPVIVAQDDMQNTSSQAPFWMGVKELSLLKEQIDSIVKYRNSEGLVAFLHDSYLWIKYFENSINKREWKCNPFVFINIGPDGEVRSCGSSFGNIKKESLSDCLLNEEAFLARKRMRACPKPCLQTCWAHPESDSLDLTIEDFLKKISSQAPLEKKEYINKAVNLISQYQQLLEKHD